MRSASSKRIELVAPEIGAITVGAAFDGRQLDPLGETSTPWLVCGLQPCTDMSNPSVRLHVELQPQMARIHVVIRLVLLLALGALGWSSFYWAIYLALPALAALPIAEKGGERYLAEGAPGIVRMLKWFAGAYAYLWLLTDAPPTTRPGGPVELEVEPSGKPTPASALLRLLYSLPALVVLAVLSLAAGLMWVLGALAILVLGRLPAFIADFLAATLRYQFRLIAYHLSLVDDYPFLAESAAPHVSGSGAA